MSDNEEKKENPFIEEGKKEEEKKEEDGNGGTKSVELATMAIQLMGSKNKEAETTETVPESPLKLDVEDREVAEVAREMGIAEEEQSKLPLTLRLWKEWIWLSVMIGLPLLCIVLVIAASYQTSPIQVQPNWPCSGLPTGCPSKDTLPQAWKVVLALIPYAIVFQLILGFHLSSKIAAPFGLILVIFLGANWFADSTGSDGYIYDDLPTMMGKIFLKMIDRLLWTIFEYASNMFAALFFLEVLRGWGIVEQLRLEFQNITQKPARLILLVLFCFGMILAVVAPGGTNYLIAGSILVKMGIKPDVTEEQASRVIKEFNERHKTCKDKRCIHNTNPNDQEKIAIDTNNRIGGIAQFGNALSAAFNLLGVCVIATTAVILPLDLDADSTLTDKQNQDQGSLLIGGWFAGMIFPLSILAPLMMTWIFSKQKWVHQRIFTDPSVNYRDRLLFLFIGLLFAGMQLLIASLLGPELPCLLSGLLCLIAYIVIEKFGDMRRREWPQGKLLERRYLVPFILLLVILIVVAIPDVEFYLSGGDSKVANTILAPKMKLGGYSKVDFPWLSHSGVLCFVIAAITPLLVPYHQPSVEINIHFPGEITRDSYIKYFRRLQVVSKAITKFSAPLLMKKKKKKMVKKYGQIMKESFHEAFGEVQGIFISITAFASMSALMSNFGMTQAIAKAIVGALSNAPEAFAFFIPIIGMLGSGLTGSTTTSNLMFARLQCQTAIDLGLVKFLHDNTGALIPGAIARSSVYMITAAQMLGSTAGEIISPMNAIVITLMEGVDLKESGLIMLVFPFAIIWLFGAMLCSLVFLAPNWWGA